MNPPKPTVTKSQMKRIVAGAEQKELVEKATNKTTKLIEAITEDFLGYFNRPFEERDEIMVHLNRVAQSAREEERSRILTGVNQIPMPGWRGAKGEIVAGPYSDDRMRGPNVEQYELINRYDVLKVINREEGRYDLPESNNQS